MLERQDVVGGTGAGQAWRRRGLAQALLQPLDGSEIQTMVAPLQDLHRLEFMRLQPVDQIGAQRFDLAGDAKGAVAQVTAGSFSVASGRPSGYFVLMSRVMAIMLRVTSLFSFPSSAKSNVESGAKIAIDPGAGTRSP